jgi:hypothetical protein
MVTKQLIPWFHVRPLLKIKLSEYDTSCFPKAKQAINKNAKYPEIEFLSINLT